MFQKDNRSKTMRWNPVMIRCFLSICQVYYLIVFNSIVTARLEQITFWKLVLNLIDAFFLPRSFSVTVLFWLLVPITILQYPSLPLLPYTWFFCIIQTFFPRFYVLWIHTSIFGKTKHSTFILYSLKAHKFCKVLKQKDF